MYVTSVDTMYTQYPAVTYGIYRCLQYAEMLGAQCPAYLRRESRISLSRAQCMRFARKVHDHAAPYYY